MEKDGKEDREMMGGNEGQGRESGGKGEEKGKGKRERNF